MVKGERGKNSKIRDSELLPCAFFLPGKIRRRRPPPPSPPTETPKPLPSHSPCLPLAFFLDFVFSREKSPLGVFGGGG